jgi:ABC-type lipoprotein export system ATPase subunit
MQRVALYMALLSDAEVVLADEPSSGLDSDSLKRLVAVFENFAAAGKTIIIATHDNRLALMTGQHYEIRDGCLLRKDPRTYQADDGLGTDHLAERVFQ